MTSHSLASLLHWSYSVSDNSCQERETDKQSVRMVVTMHIFSPSCCVQYFIFAAQTWGMFRKRETSSTVTYPFNPFCCWTCHIFYSWWMGRQKKAESAAEEHQWSRTSSKIHQIYEIQQIHVSYTWKNTEFLHHWKNTDANWLKMSEFKLKNFSKTNHWTLTQLYTI